jgi:hypothetical protein
MKLCDILNIILRKRRYKEYLTVFTASNLLLNLLYYSILHRIFTLIMVGMITNISDRKDTFFLSINKVLSNKIKLSLLKNSIFLYFE